MPVGYKVKVIVLVAYPDEVAVSVAVMALEPLKFWPST
jgi:hypothetical protein